MKIKYFLMLLILTLCLFLIGCQPNTNQNDNNNDDNIENNDNNVNDDNNQDNNNNNNNEIIEDDTNDNNENENNENENNENENNENENNEPKQVKLAIDLIDNHLEIFENKRVGLITNPTGINSEYKSSIDVLYEKVNLVCLFAPEHGIRGAVEAGGTIGNDRDAVTGLPVFSLYGNTKKPTKAMMDEIDILCIDIQDAGARFYTYIYTMAYAMLACKEYNKKFVVFDRPNPISGEVVEGNILQKEYSSFIGLYPIVQRHGMTIGELAMYFNIEEQIFCDLTVIKMENWDRSYYYDDCNLPWVLPSPNMPTVDTAIVYPGTGIFEGTNLSEGRGTTRPFELIGAPFINSIEFAEQLNSLQLDGVYFRPASFTPTTSKHENTQCFGVQVHVTDRSTFDAVKTGWAMLDVVRKLYPNDLEWTSTINLITGCGYIKSGLYDLQRQFEIIDNDTKKFNNKRIKYLLY